MQRESPAGEQVISFVLAIVRTIDLTLGKTGDVVFIFFFFRAVELHCPSVSMCDTDWWSAMSAESAAVVFQVTHFFLPHSG